MTVNTSTDQFTTDSSESPIIESSDNIDDSIIPSTTTENDTSDTSKEEDSITTDKQKISESTDKSPTRKIAKKSDDSDYFFFGYIPNYKIPIINLKISYPVDVIADNVR